MANPRQRRKARSTAHRTVKTTNAKKLRKHPAINGPEVLKKAWDVRKTVRQNYAALGLAPTLAPRESGGTEDKAASLKPVQPLDAEDVISDSPDQQQSPIPAGSSASAKAQQPLRKGFGRIIRDKDGNVVDVVLPEDEEEGNEAAGDVDMDAADAPAVSQKGKKGKRKPEQEVTPWGPPMEDWVPDNSEVAERVAAAQKTKRTAVTEELEKLASEATKVPRHASAQEVDLLRELIQKHGDDIDGMSRDKKLNKWQKTAGEIRRAIKKAGGPAAILAAAKEA